MSWFEHPTLWPDFYNSLLSGEPGRVREAVALLHERDRSLEDFLNTLPYTLTVHFVTFTDGLVSDRYYVAETGYLVKVLASLTVDGSTDTVIDVQRNDAPIDPPATITLASTAHTGLITLHQLFDAKAQDYVTVESTTAGTDASGLVVLLIFRPFTP